MNPVFSETEKYRAAIAGFDEANDEDPHLVGDVPSEVLYARRMTEWLEKLYPDAGEALHLAARAQHIRRWRVPRDQYPMTRAGYHQWRTFLYSFHADEAEKILRGVGYDEATIARVRSLLRKEKLKTDSEMQKLEDVICLVFLESYFAEFAEKHEEEKVIGILRRTWKKMSANGQATALKLNLSDAARELIERALAI